MLMKKNAVIFLTGFILASVVVSFINMKRDEGGGASRHPLLARRIFVDKPSDIIIKFVDLRTKLRKYAKAEDKVGIYFEYLPTGVHVGINDREEFYRASLIKVPLVMRAYKLMEEGFIKRDENLLIRRDFLNGTYGDLYRTGAGTERSLSEIIGLILKDSDNTAYNALLDRVNQALKEKESKSEKGIDEVYDYLDITREENTNAFEISPRDYSSVLKSLFFSAYLNYDSSNEILGIMTEAKFNKLLKSAIPDNIPVAHKFGIYQSLDSKDKKSVHADCGIVYFPDRPYVLCVMVNTSDSKKAEKYISEISGTVYDYVSKINRE